ncbi:MAG: ADP-glyceromanno-heptose 6-epimerase [Gammaproteobacteria bacterium]
MIVVTGGAGFIGSNIVTELNRRGIDDIVVIDDLTDGRKFSNFVDAKILDYIDKEEFRRMLGSRSAEFVDTTCMIHLGACSDTTEWDGKYMMDNNYAYSKEVLHYSVERNIRLVYASSAAVYGLNPSFVEAPANEKPLNVYGYSKLMFDRYVRQLPDAQQSNIVGLRYFNVYGPHESHKGKMASVFYHFNNQLVEDGTLKLFGASHGCKDGEHRRDFVHVDDAVAVTLWMSETTDVSGIFNCGTGRAATFNDVAKAIISYHGDGAVNYVNMPEHLRKAYQSYTCADLTSLRGAGYDASFAAVAEGAKRYLDCLTGNI